LYVLLVVICVGVIVLFMRFWCSVDRQSAEPSDAAAAVSNVLSQPRQQAPPTDDDSDVLFPSPSPRQQAPPTDDDSDVLFPSPPPELSCDLTDAIQWLADSVPCSVTNTESSNWSCVKPSVAATETAATETNIDSATLISDSEKNTSSMLALITSVKLRKTAVTDDRSAPRLN